MLNVLKSMKRQQKKSLRVRQHVPSILYWTLVTSRKSPSLYVLSESIASLTRYALLKQKAARHQDSDAGSDDDEAQQSDEVSFFSYFLLYCFMTSRILYSMPNIAIFARSSLLSTAIRMTRLTSLCHIHALSQEIVL